MTAFTLKTYLHSPRTALALFPRQISTTELAVAEATLKQIPHHVRVR